MISPTETGVNIRSSSCSELSVECRICHDEDTETNMECPCSCRGSLKFAHRKCVQRWCDEKGDIVCEICQMPFEPDYRAPFPQFHHGGVFSMGFGWEIARRDLRNRQFMSMVSSDDESMEELDFDDYRAISPRSLTCCRVVAIIFMGLLVLRHTLPFLISGAADHSMMTLHTFLMLRTIGVFLPICIVFKAFTVAMQRRRRYQLVSALSDEENDFPHPRSPTIRAD